MSDDAVTVKRLMTNEDAQRSFCCMTEVHTPWPEALCACRNWLVQNLGKAVEGYHLQLETGEVVGHLYYALTPQALIAYNLEPDIGILYCEWVQRRYQGRGLGNLLFETFLAEMRAQSARGILVEASDRDEQMHFSHYLSRGFTTVYETGSKKLLYFPINSSKVVIQPMKTRLQPSKGTPVDVVLLYGYACPYEVSTFLILKQVVREFGNQVVLREETLSPETLHAYGVSRGIYINGRQKLLGGETEQAVRQAILEEL